VFLILKWNYFGLCKGYVYIGLVGYVVFAYNTWKKKYKNNVKSIYFQKIVALKKKISKQTQNTKNWPKLFSKSFKICPNRDLKNA